MASKSKQLIACMSKAKGDAKKVAACKASFGKSLKGIDSPQGPRAAELEFLEDMLKSDPWGNYIRKGSLYKPTGQDSVILDSLLREKMKK